LIGSEDDEIVHEVTVPFEAMGTRLDAHLAQALPLSRSRIQALVEEGRVTLDGALARTGSLKLRGGERLVLVQPAPEPTALLAEDLPLSVLFEDEDLIVLDKAAGMAVHPGAGLAHGTVANAVLHRVTAAGGTLSISGDVRPGIVHRLDKDTSGCLVVAKNDAAHGALSAAFAARAVEKRYTAYCIGRPADPLELVTGHRRADGDRRRFTTKVPPPDGATAGVRLAHTRARVLAVHDGAAILDVELLTGRTHQIRAHLADIGHPLLQDEMYGGAHSENRLRAGLVRDACLALTRQALHARTLAFDHPRTQERLSFTAPLPADLARLDDAIRAGSRPITPASRAHKGGAG
jgi:23S rRNA pseudouridine1911/1915/1917 synthase